MPRRPRRRVVRAAGARVLEAPPFHVVRPDLAEGTGRRVDPSVRTAGEVGPVDVATGHHLAASRRRHDVDRAQESTGGVGGWRHPLVRREGRQRLVAVVARRHLDAADDRGRARTEVDDEGHRHVTGRTRRTGGVDEGTEGHGAGEGERRGPGGDDQGRSARPVPPPGAHGDLPLGGVSISGCRGPAPGDGHGIFSIPGRDPGAPGDVERSSMTESVPLFSTGGTPQAPERHPGSQPVPEGTPGLPTVADQRRIPTGFPARGLHATPAMVAAHRRRPRAARWARPRPR